MVRTLNKDYPNFWYVQPCHLRNVSRFMLPKARIDLKFMFQSYSIQYSPFFLEGWEKIISSNALHFPYSTEQKWLIQRFTWDQLSTRNRSIELQSKSKMLFESMRKCSIRIPHKILSFVDLKIFKIGQEIAKLAIPESVPFGHNMHSKSRDEPDTSEMLTRAQFFKSSETCCVRNLWARLISNVLNETLRPQKY